MLFALSEGVPAGSAPRAARHPRVSKPTASIARSIARSMWLRRLAGFVVFDVLLCAVLVATFVFHCNLTLPAGTVALGFIPQGGATVALLGGVAAQPEVAGDAAYQVTLGAEGVAASALPPADVQVARVNDIVYRVVLATGETFTFPLSSALPYVLPALVLVVACEAVSLVAGVFSTPRIRRKLRPLNELALTAEAIGSAAASESVLVGPSRTSGAAGVAAGARAGAGKEGPRGSTGANAPRRDDAATRIQNLERAITSASVDSPHITTHDADLRSIEVALNGLLRRMQEAKLQQMRFVSDVSHELRTPIAVIQGYVNMLDRWGKTDEAVLDESIEALKAESAHMQELVEQLLFLARGDSGRTTLSRTTFNLAAVVADVWEESRMIDAAHEYELMLAPGAEADAALQMVGDLALVKQSMRIMVQNAAKYSPEGTAIRLSAQVGPGAGEVSYSVRDEGVGMSPEDVTHAFERFWRSDEARSGSTGGTGLGLSIAKWIVDAHEGRIEVVSSEGVGTRFTVCFAAAER